MSSNPFWREREKHRGREERGKREQEEEGTWDASTGRALIRVKNGKPSAACICHASNGTHADMHKTSARAGNGGLIKYVVLLLLTSLTKWPAEMDFYIRSPQWWLHRGSAAQSNPIFAKLSNETLGEHFHLHSYYKHSSTPFWSAFGLNGLKRSVLHKGPISLFPFQQEGLPSLTEVGPLLWHFISG